MIITSEERLSEIESTNPETRRRASINPLIYKNQPINEIYDITS
jgi:hypothetical protein